MKSIPLNSRASIPVIGLGTWRLTGAAGADAVAYALSAGYSHIDTADIYGNHRDIAAGIRKAGVKREQIFITTKIWNKNHSREDVLRSGGRFLEELETEYVDLLLIHWPIREVPVEETLRAMDELKRQGSVRAIGVANFTARHLRDALASGVEITNNQVEVRPDFAQSDLRAFCSSHNLSVTAHSSLRAGSTELPVIAELAGTYGKTPAQIIINWTVARGMVAIPKSARPEKIKENIESLDFEMSEDDLQKMDRIPQNKRGVVPSWGEFDQ